MEFDAGHDGFYGSPPSEGEPFAWHPPRVRAKAPAQCRETGPVVWLDEAPNPGPQPACAPPFLAVHGCGTRTREFLVSPYGGCPSFELRAQLNRGLVIDCFAGGGGASTGIEQAIGRSVDVAINHSPAAVAMHKANHPKTTHWCQDIRSVTPRQVCGDRKVWIVWLSPDCFPAGTMVLTRTGYRPIEQIAIGDEVLTHAGRWQPVTRLWHSQKQLTEIRGHGHPGLVVSPGHPILTRRRDDRWNNDERRSERRLGPASWQPASVLGKGNYWSTPTAFPPSEAPPLAAVEGRRVSVTPELLWLAGRYVADGWTRLDDAHAELVLSFGKHKVDAARERLRALADRLAADGDDPIRWAERELRTSLQFTACHRPLVGFEQRAGSRSTSVCAPVRTVTASNDHALVTPFLAMATHTTSGDRVASAEKPLNTITCAKGGEMMLVAPTLVQSGYGEREGQAPRTLDIESPLTTVVAGGQKHNLVAALLTTNFTGAIGRKMTEPVPTVTGRDHTSVTTAHLASSHLLKLYGTSHSADVRGPLPTVTGGGQHLAEVRALMELVADPGTLGPDDDCVTVRINGQWYVIVDIHMRMLQPRELFGAHGFPSDYLIHFYYQHKGKRKKATKTDQIKLAGNSVCPQVAKRLILANAYN